MALVGFDWISSGPKSCYTYTRFFFQLFYRE